MTAINKISRIDLAESSKSVSELLMRGNNNLDLIRLLAALMVVFGHSFALSLTQNLTEPFSYLFPFTYSGSIAVKVFFFISGLLVTNSILTSRSIKKFIISRFFRIYPAFAVTIIITGLIIGPLAYRGSLSAYITDSSYLDYIINSLRFKTPYFIKGVFVGNHDNGSMNGSLWTIGLEVSAYLVVIAAFILAGLKNRQLSSCLCLLIIIIPLTNIEGLNFIVIKSSEAYLLPSCFALGALFAINKDNIILDYKIPLALYII
ncbi:acyltransferase family protein, partial [Aeromonas caviae]|uniref:acyltransferase family protein n=1 Tax=Aeromonas caviae TaxID=648 RepID=UPI0025B6CC51